MASKAHCWLGSVGLLITHALAQLSDKAVLSSPPFAGPCNPADTGVCTRENVTADFIIGGLFSIRGSQRSAVCEDKLTGEGLLLWQLAETIRFVVDQVNRNSSILRSFRLGYDVRDDCAIQRLALKQAVAFVSDACVSDAPGDKHQSGPSRRRPTIGVVGPTYSSMSKQVTDLLGLFRIPLISPGASSPYLDDKKRYRYFFRTHQSDVVQVRALVAFAQLKRWKYISVVYTNDAYGKGGALKFREEAERRGICIAAFTDVDPVSSYASNVSRHDAYAKSVKELISDNTPLGTHFRLAKVILLYMVSPEAKEWLSVAGNISKFRSANYTILAAKGWATRVDADIVPLGTVGLFPSFTPPESVVKHLEGLRLNRKETNPWLAKVYSQFYNCSPDDPCATSSLGELHTQREGSSRLGLVGAHVHLSPFLPTAANAAYALAYALETLHKEWCGEGLCDKRQIRHLAEHLVTTKGREEFFDVLLNVNFVSPVTGEWVNFTREGNPQRQDYTFNNVQSAMNTSEGRHWVRRVATYFPLLNTNLTTKYKSLAHFITEERRLIYGGGGISAPTSRCSPDCRSGEMAKMTGPANNLRCCWLCEGCDSNHFITSQFSTCQPCARTAQHNTNKTDCIQLPVWRWRNTSTPAVILITISVSALAVVALLLTWFLHELSFSLEKLPLGSSFTVVGVVCTVLSFLSCFLQGASPSSTSCSLQHFFWGLALLLPLLPTLVYTAALFVLVGLLGKLSAQLSASSMRHAGEQQLHVATLTERDSNWIELGYLLSTNTRRSVALLVLVTVGGSLLGAAEGLSGTEPTEVLVAHMNRKIWCSPSPTVTLAVCMSLLVIMATGVMAFITLRSNNRKRRQHQLESFFGIDGVLSSCIYFAVTANIFSFAFLAIWLTVTGVQERIVILEGFVFAVQLSNLLMVYAPRFYLVWSSHFSVEIAERAFNDCIVAGVLCNMHLLNSSRAPMQSRSNCMRVAAAPHYRQTAVETARSVGATETLPTATTAV